MTDSASTPLPTHCPLCRQANQCAMEMERATGLKQAPCWCTEVKFEPAVLDRLPAASRGLACICQACSSRASASA